MGAGSIVAVCLTLLVGSSSADRLPVDGTFMDPRVHRITGRHDPAFEPSGPLAGRGHGVGDTINFWAQDFSDDPVYGTFYLLSATCRHVGERSYIFVEDDAWGVHFDEEDLAGFALALEESTPSDSGGIIEVDSSTFGPIPDEIDGDPRIYFLVLDIRDPVESGLTILGYFSPYNQFTEYEARFVYGGHSNEVEMLYIDCSPASGEDAIYVSAHELVHLIQWGIAPFSGEELWVIENQAQSGPFVCGYGVEQVQTFLEVGGVSPLGWTSYTDDYLYVAGYGAGYLFFAYIYENFGGSGFLSGFLGFTFLWSSLRAEASGLDGLVEAIAASTGSQPDMEGLLEDWMVANWVDDVSVGDGRYGYESFRIADFDPLGQGGRRGLDYVLSIDSFPARTGPRELRPFTGEYYGLSSSTGEGSFRASAEGLGELVAYMVTGGDSPGAPVAVERLSASGGSGLAVETPVDCDLLLLARSDFGLTVDVVADNSLEQSGLSLLVYPVPSFGELFVEFESSGLSTIFSVFDLSGHIVLTADYGQPEQGHVLLEVGGASGLSSGLYFFSFSHGSTVETGKIALVR